VGFGTPSELEKPFKIQDGHFFDHHHQNLFKKVNQHTTRRVFSWRLPGGFECSRRLKVVVGRSALGKISNVPYF
jgi:hypothetical protein